MSKEYCDTQKKAQIGKHSGKGGKKLFGKSNPNFGRKWSDE